MQSDSNVIYPIGIASREPQAGAGMGLGSSFGQSKVQNEGVHAESALHDNVAGEYGPNNQDSFVQQRLFHQPMLFGSQNNAEAAFSAGSFGNSSISFNHLTHSPSANPPEHVHRRYSNNSGSERIGFMHTASSFTAPRASLLTSKLAKVQKKSGSPNANDKSLADDAKGYPYPYPNPRAVSHRTSSNSNIKGIAISHKGSPTAANSASSVSSSFKDKQDAETRSLAYNAPSAVSSSYSSAPVSLGKSNGFIPILTDPTCYNGPQPHSIAAPGANAYSAFSFHRPAPAAPTTNISMETASSSTLETGSRQELSTEFHRTNSSSSTIHVENQPFNAAREIYDPTVCSQTQNGITLDSKGEEHLNIVEFPPQELLLMLSSLLQKIIDANDTLHPDHYNHASQLHQSNRFTANVLAFHGKNVPAIPIHNYFLRILKYCPMTNEVFLSLLVYFDRIAKRTNVAAPNDKQDKQTSPGSMGFNKPSPSSQLFVMDSYNIHRLIIAGITVSSKFFSDVFYRNARYARVGGLPLDELNHIELQFILLTDFKLLIQPDELQRYADLLLKFWRREKSKSGSNSRKSSPPAPTSA